MRIEWLANRRPQPPGSITLPSARRARPSHAPRAAGPTVRTRSGLQHVSVLTGSVPCFLCHDTETVARCAARGQHPNRDTELCWKKDETKLRRTLRAVKQWAAAR